MKRYVYGALALLAFAAAAVAQAPKYYLQLSQQPGAITTPNSVIRTDANGAVIAGAPSGYADIRDYGCTVNSAVDCAAAFLAAFNAQLTSKHIAIFIPPGWLQFNSQVTLALPATTLTGVSDVYHLSLIGAGREVTQLYFPNGGGIKITYAGLNGGGGNASVNAVTIRDMSILAGKTAAGNGLELLETITPLGNPANTALSTIENVVVRGSDSRAGTFYWNNGIKITGVSNLNVTNAEIVGDISHSGSCIDVVGTVNAIGVVYNFLGLTANYCNKGLQIDSYVQGVTVGGGSNFVGDNYCIYISPGTGSDQLYISDSQFNCNTANIYLGAGTAMDIHDNLIILTGNNVIGVELEIAGDGLNLHHNYFQYSSGTGTYCIYINAAVTGGQIVNNFCRGAANGIRLAANNAYNMLIKGNTYAGITTSQFNFFAGATFLNEDAGVSLAFANVLACSAANQGRQQVISDSTINTPGALIAGGGGNAVIGVCNTTWRVLGPSAAPAKSQTAVAAPTGTANTTGDGVMMGLAAALTPVSTGNVAITVSGNVTSSVAADGATIHVRYGTGGAPSNAGALVGTTCGSTINYVSSPTTADKVPFSKTCYLTGAALATALWIDVSLAAVTGGTATISGVDVVAYEIP